MRITDLTSDYSYLIITKDQTLTNAHDIKPTGKWGWCVQMNAGFEGVA